ncbi:MAG TPA: O-antigen ligase family protein [Gaiellaceae bacterium]|nr:O-antigen ligase family protein [Gaiellaceae bacterium]
MRGASALPVVAVVAGACLLAWVDTGSIDAGDWLIYAVFAALLLAVVGATSALSLPPPAALAGLGCLAAYAAWQAVTISWSALPSLARDDALLTLFYAVVLALGLSVRGVVDRGVVVGAVAAGCGILAVATGAALRWGASPASHFADRRLAFPVSYTNGAAAMFLIGFWPALVLAARRGAPVLARSGALAAAAATLAGWLLTQSKGGGIALACSSVAMLVVARDRLRLVVPSAILAVLVGSQFHALTAAYTSGDVRGSARHAGLVLVLLAAAAAVAGAVYALVDRALELPAPVAKTVARAALVVAVAIVIAIPAAFFATVDHPGSWTSARWHSFKHSPQTDTAGTHFGTLGSNRYDFWRVALAQFEHHPVSGIGARGFGPAYLLHRRSTEVPARAHSFELDALGELGVIGFALLVAALAPLVWLAARGAWCGDLAGTAAFGAAAYFFTHASADWIWTIPAVGVPFFALLGTACARREPRPLPRLAGAGVAVASAAVAFVLFAPPWLSATLSSSALDGSSSPGTDLRWARRLDPLSVEPYVVAASIARTPAEAVPPLQTAARKEPRSVDTRFQLGLAYLRANRRAAARRELQAALRLEPREASIERALRRVGRAQ